jgi:hypothetical protein
MLPARLGRCVSSVMPTMQFFLMYFLEFLYIKDAR